MRQLGIEPANSLQIGAMHSKQPWARSGPRQQVRVKSTQCDLSTLAKLKVKIILTTETFNAVADSAQRRSFRLLYAGGGGITSSLAEPARDLFKIVQRKDDIGIHR